MLGKRLGNFSDAAYSWAGFSSGPYRGQCVTYVRGRAKEKLGVEFAGGFDSAKQMVDVGKARGFKTSKTVPAADSFIVFADGRYRGDLWGHVYFCEGISGDDYFYTEANSNNDHEVSADDGILKKASLKALLANKSFLGFVYLKKESTATGGTTAPSGTQSLPAGKISVLKGKNYTLTANVNVRYGAGVSFAKKLRTELSADGMKHSLSQQYACLTAGTTVTANSVKVISDKEIWINIPSGWIAAMYNGELYIDLKVKITADVLNVREKPNTSSKVVSTLKNGAVVSVSEVSGDWGKTSHGWIHLGYTAAV